MCHHYPYTLQQFKDLSDYIESCPVDDAPVILNSNGEEIDPDVIVTGIIGWIARLNLEPINPMPHFTVDRVCTK